MEPPRQGTRLGVFLRVGAFAFLAIIGLMLLGPLFVGVRKTSQGLEADSSFFVGGAMATFAAAAIANAVAIRIYERGRLADIGLGWSGDAGRNLVVGLGSGAGSALVVVLAPVIVGAAGFAYAPGSGFHPGALLLVSFVLLFGAVGEELLFRGYGFQVLIPQLGPFATILPISVLFAVAHASNPNITMLARATTLGWGILLGWSFLRSGDLWLPIGLHFGWNLGCLLLGAPISGLVDPRIVVGYVVQGNPLWTGGDYGPEAGLPALLVLPLLAAYLWKAPVRRQLPFLLRGLEEA